MLGLSSLCIAVPFNCFFILTVLFASGMRRCCYFYCCCFNFFYNDLQIADSFDSTNILLNTLFHIFKLLYFFFVPPSLTHSRTCSLSPLNENSFIPLEYLNHTSHSHWIYTLQRERKWKEQKKMNFNYFNRNHHQHQSIISPDQPSNYIYTNLLRK